MKLSDYLFYSEPGITLYCGDCREVLPLVEPPAMIFTSPPYLSQREYLGLSGRWGDVVPPTLAAAPDGGHTQVLVNLGLVHRDGEVIEYWSELHRAMRASGWRLFGWYVWDKGFAAPGDWQGRLGPSHEFVFHFNRAARQVNKTKRTNYGGSVRHGNGMRRADGSMADGLCTPGIVSDWKIPDSVTRVAPEQRRGGLETKHPATFPEWFAAEYIAAFTAAGETVIDPFVGSGTTLQACKELGRRAIGIEIEPKYCEIAVKRLRQEVLDFGVTPMKG